MADANQELDRFAYVASHDMREPLRKIQSFGAILAENMDGKLDEESLYCLQGMLDGASRLARMLDGLLQYSRAARSSASGASCLLGAIVDESVQDLAKVAGDVQWRLGDLPKVPLDSVQAKVLVDHILENSLRFRSMERPLCITVDAQAEPAGVSIRFQDNGIGFSPEHNEAVFGLFTKLHGRSTELAGDGLGLAVCRRIVEAAGGRISAEGIEGEGCTITLHLPVVG